MSVLDGRKKLFLCDYCMKVVSFHGGEAKEVNACQPI